MQGKHDTWKLPPLLERQENRKYARHLMLGNISALSDFMLLRDAHWLSTPTTS